MPERHCARVSVAKEVPLAQWEQYDCIELFFGGTHKNLAGGIKGDSAGAEYRVLQQQEDGLIRPGLIHDAEKLVDR